MEGVRGLGCNKLTIHNLTNINVCYLIEIFIFLFLIEFKL